MPAVDDPFSIAASLPGQLATLKAQVKDLSVNRTQSPSILTVGAGGITDLGTLAVTGLTTLSSAVTLGGGVAGPVAATGALSGTTITGTGAISGASVAATGAITGASVAVTGAASSATSAVTGSSTVGGNSTVSGQIFIPNGFAAVSGYTIAYINNDGRISVGASAARFKQDFQPVHAEPLIAGIYAANLLHFRLIAAVDEIDGKMGPLREGEQRGTAAIEIGLLADQLETIGLGEFVYRDGGGAVLGIQYERLTVPLIAVVQSLDRRLRAGGL